MYAIRSYYGIDASCEIGDRAEGASLLPHSDDMVHRLPADILHRRERVVDHAAAKAFGLARLAGEIGLAAVDVGRANLDRETRRLLPENSYNFV